jgi:aminoglycoside N3'-acetyltransferase
MKVLSKSDIKQGLLDIGLSRGMFVEVHSSLSSFGHVEGGAETIISSLMEIIGKEGAIVMSAFPMSAPLPLSEEDKARGLTLKIKILPPDSVKRTGMGIIPDTFRQFPGVITGSGLHRVAAWGRDVEKHSRGFSHLIANDGHALLLGVDIYSLTSMHYVESDLLVEIKNIFKAPDELLKFYPADKWYIETGSPPVKAWHKIQSNANQKGYINKLKIGNSGCMFFKVCQIINLYKHALRTDPYSLYGLNDLK